MLILVSSPTDKDTKPASAFLLNYVTVLSSPAATLFPIFLLSFLHPHLLCSSSPLPKTRAVSKVFSFYSSFRCGELVYRMLQANSFLFLVFLVLALAASSILLISLTAS